VPSRSSPTHYLSLSSPRLPPYALGSPSGGRRP
jgi:hypothetical protein